MKLKLLVKTSELILGAGQSNDEPRADMYLPIWLLAFSFVLIAFGIGLGVWTVLYFSVGTAIAAACCLLLGAAALLCWKNQTIQMLLNDSFEYTTFLGNKKLYRFNQIRGLKRNSDSMTLLVGEEKVHIESCAVLSERLVERINQALVQMHHNY